ncbi:adenylate/guanylate cyclase domain-containing protein [Magnetospirillum sp. SS-4]|uniref:adenylate/guanylate cyclase domain-containing protein n=1 Tax=Magnetospirillum sp. SS-4 TaxID=2681465 RepID=UPI001381141A|nr:adenylate/guanylate cyclase domain-containing protein [Magnetospirillum sp. SS-4]CAA7625139.1 Adenylate cyclase 1 [Magnetospirillum sp. SS-4]
MRGLTLQVNIITAFASLLTVIIVTLLFYAYQKNSGSVLDLMERFVGRVAVSGINSTITLLEPAASHVQAAAELAAIDVARGRDGSLFPYMMSLLETTPQIQSVYLAFEADGRFLQAFPIPPGTDKFGANDNPPPPGAKFALRVVDWAKGVYSDTWTYVARDGTVVGRETSNTLKYDFRTRSWYKDLLAKPGLQWTDLVVFTSNRQPGIAAVYPIFGKDGRVIGAAAANIATRRLSDFLAGLDLGKSGIALIVDEKEQLIAFPDAAKAVRQDGLKLSLVKAKELNDVRVSDAFAAHRANPSPLVRFESGGKRYLGSFSGLPDRFGKKWLLAIVVLEDDFVGTLKDNTQDIVVVGLGMMVGGMIILTMLSRWISRPLERLGGEILKIQKFDLEGPIAIHSFVVEVNQLIHSLNMMKRALRSFGMFVPRDLVRDLVAGGRPIELGGHDRTLTVMFTDVADFTSLSERMEPGALLVHVSRHLAAISECIGEENGTVDKYIGDAVMAFWGAPNPCEDHALRACVAALKAKRVQSLMNEDWASQGLPTMFVRMGLHTANVIVGNIGSTQRMSYTVMGDGVNVASRLEGVNKSYGTQICISDAVARVAGEAIMTRPLDVVAVKGRKAGELVHELVALRHGPAELLATPEQAELCRLTSAAFEAYRGRRWEQAIELYRQLAGVSANGKLSATFIDRCTHYLAEPPPDDWSGIHEMKTK